MKNKKKEFIISLVAFLVGVFLMDMINMHSQTELQKQQYSLFDTEETIISISDHVSVKLEDCMNNSTCDVKKTLNEIDTKYVGYREPYEARKKQLISNYPSLVSDEDRKVYGVK